jgi:sulfur relay (sulfurtransferase) complex TusBCD TusD component (DsrE family)
VKIGIVIYSNDPETVWNAFRFGNYAVKEGDEVTVFLLGKGVESESIDTEVFTIMELMRSFVEAGGAIAACGSCLKIHQLGSSELCPISTMADLYTLVKESDKVVTF